MLIGFALYVRVVERDAHVRERLLREQRVGVPARRFGDVTLDSLDDTEEYAAQRQAAEVAKTRT